ncbi:hypothetical protein JM83_1318 [Gillisia sp. Hel_I_86]|uniref:hypothetical protein n=1 Tax=Gillisia sp. Hel_I_86 TaxID=1249981 RepID=UPI0011997B6C|nr:hypothetical protein [Gillisia sp. Hel_I_86]TVZ26362.1 hypothetical protein JM83_1318 [Gillisia sp. Hel_I_86]
MKKLILVFVSALALISCNIDDEGPKTLLAASIVTNIDVPEFFEAGKTYDIDVTYLLPDACHTAAGVKAQRGSISNGEEEFRQIYVTGVSSFDANLTECDKEAEDEELIKESTFTMSIASDEDEPYTFYLWAGLDENDDNIFTEVVVPVGDPGSAGVEAAE